MQTRTSGAITRYTRYAEPRSVALSLPRAFETAWIYALLSVFWGIVLYTALTAAF